MQLKKLTAIRIAILAALFLASQPQRSVAGDTLNFNTNWAYHLGEVAGAEKVEFSDANWVPVTLPHTLAMETKYLGRSNYKGTGWYRRYFTLDSSFQGKRIYLDFDGVMINGTVFLNGEKIATHAGGYMKFSVDLTDRMKLGQNNLLAVQVSNLDDADTPPGKPELRMDFHYFGGIYRNVTLRIQDPLRITDPMEANQVAGGGVFVTYPEVSAASAQVKVKTQVANDRPAAAAFQLKTTVVDADGRTVGVAQTSAATLASKSAQDLEQTISLKNPKLWHPDHPYRYTLVSEVVADGKTVDSLKTKIGVRRIDFKPDGFYINGEKLYIRGGNRHQQFQNIGCAGPDSLQRKDALALKECGFNGVRAAHYPQSPAFLDACDELGILVIECQPSWQQFTKSQAFWDNTIRDARQMIRRDRNRPSVVLWETSLNETNSPNDWKTAVTQAAHEEYPGDQLFLADDGISPCYNVGYKVVLRNAAWMDREPTKPFVTREWGDWETASRCLRTGGEQGLISQVVSRQVYLNGDGYNDWGGLDSCERIAGVFLWSWMDHTRGCVEIPASCGAVDINRYPKFCNDWLRSQMDARNPAFGPMVSIANYNLLKTNVQNWNFSSYYHGHPGKWNIPWSDMNVMVFSNCDSVRLYQNGKLLEEITRQKNAETAPFIAKKGGSPYYVFKLPECLAGTLKAEGIIDNKVVATQEVRTPEEPARVTIEPAPKGMPLVADGSDLMPVYFKIVDRNGTLIPTSSHTIHITVEGEGSLVGKGLPRLQVETQQVEAGLGFAYIRTTGKPGRIVIKAESQGLQAAQQELVSVPSTASFAPDGKHAAWTHDERDFEADIAAAKAAANEVALKGSMLAANEIKAITASCPSVNNRGVDRLTDKVTEWGTGWLADSQQLPQSVTFEFKSPQNLQAMRIFWEKDSTWYTYEVETSTDGNKWTKVVDTKTVTGQETTPVKFINPQSRVQFARIVIQNAKASGDLVVIGIAEVNFFKPN